MFRVLELQQGRTRVCEGPELAAPPPPGTLRWIDLAGQDHAQLALLRDRFGFHHLALEDCANFDQRPKSEEYADHLFLVTQGFTDAQEDEHPDLHELHTFLGERYMVTVHQSPIPALERVWSRMAEEPALLERGVDFAYYLVADGMVDDNFPILDRIADELELLEDQVLSSPSQRDLQRIFQLKHHLVSMRRVLSPQRDVLGLMARRGDPRVSERTALYLRDVYDHLVRINESVEASRDVLGNTLDAYMSAVGQRTNEIMKALTLMSAVFLPLAFVVGFFGQNFEGLLGIEAWPSSAPLMWVMVASCVAIPAGMLFWFRHKRWL